MCFFKKKFYIKKRSDFLFKNKNYSWYKAVGRVTEGGETSPVQGAQTPQALHGDRAVGREEGA